MANEGNILDYFFTDSEALLRPLRITILNIGGTSINAFDILEFVFIFFVAYTLGRLSEASISKLGSKYGNIRTESLSVFGRFVHWGILTVGVLIGLSMIGLPITHLAILVSALSVGVGFGLQTIVNNSIAGIILMSEHAVNIGDIIQTPEGRIGEVTMVTIRATRITTADGQHVIIPNASLIEKPFVNFTVSRRGTRRRFPFSVPYGSDLKMVTKAVLAEAAKVPYCFAPDDKHEMEVGITDFGNFGINMELVVWVRSHELMEPYRMESAFLEAINTACVKNGITIPGPSYTVTVNSAGPVSVTSPAAAAGEAFGQFQADSLAKSKTKPEKEEAAESE
jgi:small-conductance mechanosensitive channel